MSIDTLPGTKREIDGRLRIYDDGYWIKAYQARRTRCSPSSGASKR